MNNIIKKTPLDFCERLSIKYDCNVYLKREDTQIVRSFKIRGAYNKIMKYKNNKNNKNNSFVTASAGNHAQGVAYICNKLEVMCYIFVPNNTPLQKISRIKYFGGEKCKLIIDGDNFDESLIISEEFTKNKNMVFIHPFDDIDVIEGQSYIAKEICQELNPDIILVGVGGGGLISGIISYLEQYNMTNSINCSAYGTEPLGAASMCKSLEKNKIVTLENIDTFVDGASVKRVGKLTFDFAKRAKKIFKICNGELCTEIINLYQNEGIILEPAGALSVCGLAQLDKEYIKNKNVICILSGGNNDLMRYPEIIENSLRYLKLKHYFIINFKQKPGELKKYLENILIKETDITRFEYIKKNNKDSGSVLIGIQVVQPVQIEQIKENMIKYNFSFIELSSNDLLFEYLI